MDIVKIEVWDFCVPFRNGPYAMAHVTQERVYGRLLCVHADNGMYGLGEIPLSPYLSAEERRHRAAQEQAYLGPLIGQPVQALLHTAEQLAQTEGRWGGLARFALETAFLELQAKQKNQTLTEQLGGQQSDAVQGYFSITERSVDAVTRRLQEAGPERAVIQLKLGMGPLNDDIAQIAACLADMHAGQTLLADANGGWSLEAALGVMGQFDDPRIYWEEPCKTYDDNIAAARQSGQPVMIDQCVSSPAVAQRAISDNVAAVICIKPPFLGGLRAAQTIRDACVAAGIRIRIDGPWCGDIASCAILHLALSTPPELLVSGCDLREPMLIEHDLRGVIHGEDGRIAPPSGPGLGITRAHEILGAAEKVL